ncbi:MAG: GNAT family N-acetyltransferase, partial [Thiohalophilus sp.]
RFAQVLDKQTSGWQSLTLEQPIRWREYDPLERFVFRALLLDAEPADPEPDLTPDQCRYVELDRDTLIQDSRYLRELFGLLVLAHYRTRPEDLQRLLDDPNLRLFALEHREHPVAVLVLGDEGGFDAALAEEIYLGRRRPQGHLLAQSLAFHSGVPNAARYRYGRVLRIGVHPLLQRRGLGSALLARVIESLETAADLDAVGASFSASAELIPFWQRAGLNPVRLGLTREHTSGQPALLVLKPLSKQGASVYRRARERFEQHWPSLRAGPLRDIDSALAEQLQPSSISRLEKTLTQADIEDIESYVYGQRGYEVCAWPIEKLVSMLLMDTSRNSLLDSENRQLLTRKVIEKQDWSALCTEFNLDGQKAARRQLRDAVVKAWQLWEKA